MLKKIFSKAKQFGGFLEETFNKAITFAKENPELTALLVIGTGVALAYGAGAFGTSAALPEIAGTSTIASASAPTAAATIPGISTVGSMTGTAAPYLGPMTAETLATQVPTAAGPGMFGAATEALFGTPARSMATATGMQAVGSIAQAMSAEEQAEQSREEQRRQFEERQKLEREQFESQMAGRRIQFAPSTPKYTPKFTGPSGVIGRAIPRQPTQMTPSQALQLRKTGYL